MARAAASTLAIGTSAILVVPDYRDQEQLEAALRAICPPTGWLRLDARQSNPDRYREFLRCLSDAPLAIVGNRSVVYAPAANLGLIAVWDDGDPLHGEPLSPYVHARDAALLRQEQQGVRAHVSRARPQHGGRAARRGRLGAVGVAEATRAAEGDSDVATSRR